jgi:hypothetical protein
VGPLSLTEEEPLSRILLIAPVGAYTGRVKTGIDSVISGESRRGKTRIIVKLVAGEDWMQDPNYRTDFAEKLQKEITKTWKTDYPDITCEIVELPMKSEQYLSGWLLGESSRFLQQDILGSVFIDLTSGPREWEFAAIDTTNFFESVEVYYIKATNQKSPSKYGRDALDHGNPKRETVRTGESRLIEWLTPKAANGDLNFQFELFRFIYNWAKEIVKPTTQEKLWDVNIPIETDAGLTKYRDAFRARTGTFRKPIPIPKDNDKLQKSISKYIAKVDMFKLFVRTSKKSRSIRLTQKGAMLAESLFESRDLKIEKA